MRVGGKNIPGHANRIFCVKYNKTHPHIVISGGWDKTIQIYDLRVGLTVSSIFGPFVSGDSLDMIDDLIVAGSNRYKEPI